MEPNLPKKIQNSMSTFKLPKHKSKYCNFILNNYCKKLNINV